MQVRLFCRPSGNLHHAPDPVWCYHHQAVLSSTGMGIAAGLAIMHMLLLFSPLE